MLEIDAMIDETRSVSDDHQECSEIMKITDRIMRDVDFAMAGEHLHPMRFIETSDALQEQQRYCQVGC